MINKPESEFVQIRLIEAAEVDRKSVVLGCAPDGVRSLPLPYIHSFAEMVGWGEKRRAEHAAEVMSRWANRLSAQELSRHDEVCMWVATMVKRDGDRKALWAWAKSRNGGMPFNMWCRKSGFSDTTGKTAKNRAIENIVYGLRNSMYFLKNELNYDTSHGNGFSVLNYASEDEKVRTKPVGIVSWMDEEAAANVVA